MTTATVASIGSLGVSHAMRAARSHSGTGHPRPTSNIRSIDVSASATVSMRVTQTGMPASRRRRTSISRFSS